MREDIEDVFVHPAGFQRPLVVLLQEKPGTCVVCDHFEKPGGFVTRLCFLFGDLKEC